MSSSISFLEKPSGYSVMYSKKTFVKYEEEKREKLIELADRLELKSKRHALESCDKEDFRRLKNYIKTSDCIDNVISMEMSYEFDCMYKNEFLLNSGLFESCRKIENVVRVAVDLISFNKIGDLGKEELEELNKAANSIEGPRHSSGRSKYSQEWISFKQNKRKYVSRELAGAIDKSFSKICPGKELIFDIEGVFDLALLECPVTPPQSKKRRIADSVDQSPVSDYLNIQNQIMKTLLGSTMNTQELPFSQNLQYTQTSSQKQKTLESHLNPEQQVSKLVNPRKRSRSQTAEYENESDPQRVILEQKSRIANGVDQNSAKENNNSRNNSNYGSDCLSIQNQIMQTLLGSTINNQGLAFSPNLQYTQTPHFPSLHNTAVSLKPTAHEGGGEAPQNN